MQNPVITIFEVSMGYAVSRCMHVIAELGVADALGDEVQTAAQLARITGTNAGALDRALRVLSSYGVFEARNDGYAHNAASRLLRSKDPQSMRAYVRWIGSEVDWKSMEELAHSIRTGEPAANVVTPGGTWEYLAQHPEWSEIFDQAMTGKANGQISTILKNYNFSTFKTIADIGGGRGHLLKAVVESTPGARGVLFDQPHVVAEFADTTRGRIAVQGGDFFNDALPACDAYLIMQVIHDWSDAESIAILKAIRRAAPPHAKLLLIEAILPEESKPDWVQMLDIFMLIMLSGKERTRREFAALLGASGFRLDRTIDAGLGTWILEASAI